MKKTLLTFGILIAASTHSMADCRVYPNRILPHLNDTPTIKVDTDTGCRFFFRSGGQTTYTSSKIVTKPRIGSLRQSGEFEFTYGKKAKFVGNDSFVISVCGESRNGKGCSTITYDINVK